MNINFDIQIHWSWFEHGGMIEKEIHSFSFYDFYLFELIFFLYINDSLLV